MKVKPDDYLAPEKSNFTTTEEIQAGLERGGNQRSAGTTSDSGDILSANRIKVIAGITTFPTLNQSGDMRYYNANDGKFYHLTSDGQIKEMSEQTL